MIKGINAVHWLLYSKDAEADRAFFRDVLGLKHVDAGGGWLIFALPPAELGVHPFENEVPERHDNPEMSGATLNLMCDDIRAALQELQHRGVPCGTVQEAEWGLHTTIQLPSGGKIGLYQPLHPKAV